MIEQLVYLGVILAAVAVFVAYVWRYRHATKRAGKKLQKSVEAGLTEPVTLHPEVDPNRCIGTGGCVNACPEGEIIGIVKGRFSLLAPNKCIGHGACMAACPVDAISLVFGSAKRGVDIPHVRDNFETNVDGIFIAGELGGMGLIRNAVTQGRQAVENIASRGAGKDPQVHDVVIVGAGPAGLSATLQAEKSGLRYVTIDQEDVGGTVLTYPRQKLVMTQPMEIPLYGKYTKREVQKEELLELWQGIVAKTGVEIRTRERLDSVVRPNGYFEVTTTAGQYATRNVLLAIGRRGTPRKLGVPGENATKVTYRLLEPEQYRGKKLLVVGGGDSAVEAATALAEVKGTEVTLSYRKRSFARVKEDNTRRIEAAAAGGRVRVVYESQVLRISQECVTLEHEGSTHEFANDYVFVFIGGELPTPLLAKMGVQIETKFGER
jgi:thioredoxin reductase/NAD-dependent dihydropyrimidine dehydrogenase PreA subunit